jgi:hypothetical protein
MCVRPAAVIRWYPQAKKSKLREKLLSDIAKLDNVLSSMTGR